ncbi:hypothetical protein ACFU99_10910 [Streptomyces sp. NPDC057654]|uniref:hypothetical protein n=1 Tax=Streptomyces sp. NPDC057654 TaxID=3346196 RepID=UPI003697BDC5
MLSGERTIQAIDVGIGIDVGIHIDTTRRVTTVGCALGEERTLCPVNASATTAR